VTSRTTKRSLATHLQRLLGRVGALRGAARRRARGLRRLSRRPPRLPAVDRLPRLRHGIHHVGQSIV